MLDAFEVCPRRPPPLPSETFDCDFGRRVSIFAIFCCITFSIVCTACSFWRMSSCSLSASVPPFAPTLVLEVLDRADSFLVLLVDFFNDRPSIVTQLAEQQQRHGAPPEPGWMRAVSCWSKRRNAPQLMAAPEVTNTSSMSLLISVLGAAVGAGFKGAGISIDWTRFNFGTLRKLMNENNQQLSVNIWRIEICSRLLTNGWQQNPGLLDEMMLHVTQRMWASKSVWVVYWCSLNKVFSCPIILRDISASRICAFFVRKESNVNEFLYYNMNLSKLTKRFPGVWGGPMVESSTRSI